MSMITEQINRLREAAIVMNGDSNIAKLFREAADTIEQLAEKAKGYNTIYYTPIEAEAYQKAFEDIRAEIASQKINRDKRFIEEIWWNSALQKCLEIIDKHNPDKVRKERE